MGPIPWHIPNTYLSSTPPGIKDESTRNHTFTHFVWKAIDLRRLVLDAS